MTKPEIRIQFASLLYRCLSQNLMELYEIKFPRLQNKREMPSEEWCKEQVDSYIKEWRHFEVDILQAMQELLKLSFYKSVIDVYVSPFLPSQSTPLLMGTRYKADEFVDALTHELLHVLISDNNEGIKAGGILTGMFPDKPPKTRIHVIIHACLKHIYLKTLEDEARLNRDIEKCKGNIPYKEAWDIVEEIGYKHLISSFVGQYKANGKTP
jgi:hypothetical protein